MAKNKIMVNLNKTRISRKFIEHKLKESGVKRLRKEAVDFLAEFVEKFVKEIGSIAVRNARFSGRKLVVKEDLEAAIRKIR